MWRFANDVHELLLKRTGELNMNKAQNYIQVCALYRKHPWIRVDDTQICKSNIEPSFFFEKDYFRECLKRQLSL